MKRDIDHGNMSAAVLLSGGLDSSAALLYEGDLAKLSLAIRNVVFHLQGEGEEAGNIWDAFALNGKVQKHPAKVVRVTEPLPWDSHAR